MRTTALLAAFILSLILLFRMDGERRDVPKDLMPPGAQVVPKTIDPFRVSCVRTAYFNDETDTLIVVLYDQQMIPINFADVCPHEEAKAEDLSVPTL